VGQAAAKTKKSLEPGLRRRPEAAVVERTRAQKPDIKDVARAAGVSVTTVSHALNGKGRISAKTRRRVQRLADSLGYRPNNTARNLVGGRTGLFGLTLSQASELSISLGDFAYFAQLMMGATGASLDHGYALMLTPASEQLAESGAIDGAIVVDPVVGDPLLSSLREAGVPVVTTGRVLDHPAFDYWVDNDHVSGVRSVLDHLARRGAERIALLTSALEISYTADTTAAYESWCAEHDLEPLVSRVNRGPTETSGFAAASKLLARPDRPDAIFATYGRLAFGASMAAEASGMRVPDDVMIVMTATDSVSANTSSVSLTAVNLYPEILGRAAAELLVDVVEGRNPTRPEPIPTRIVARASTRRKGARRNTR
jgi:DNA-binding LacI/PurR family transcriptional regulator